MGTADAKRASTTDAFSDVATPDDAAGKVGRPPRSRSARILRNVAIGLGVVALVLFALVLARVTFTPQPESEQLVTGNTDPGSSIRSYLDRPEIRDAVKQVGGNLVLCMPLGILLPVVSGRLRGPIRILVTVGIVMLLVEAVQGWFIVGRAFDIDDVILNAFGAFLAYIFVGRYLAARVHPRRTPWWRRRERSEPTA
ncbi:VanZ family protein [Streptomyces sp. SID3343]|uniref:VanZ family protein n=1 Tax=Streptomyces sp. SID3343 TaxID=2690260 RepID=UPI00136E3DEE|nr:VanZ family protein [Streptomyces sp. SID3343]MYW00944.1 VanZ family protein [Streptomyces sp. SID3343]